VRQYSLAGRPIAAALFLSTLLGCATTPAPVSQRAPSSAELRSLPPNESGGLDDMLRSDLARDHAFRWSAGRRLVWSDFQGSPPGEGPEGARISYTLYSAWRCRGQEFEFRVLAAMRPRQSWVKTVVLNDNAQRRSVLSHEQTHFDLGELHARRMRQVFDGLRRPCGRSDGGLADVAQRLGDDEKAEQRRYDAETNHGLLAAQQASWTLQTRRRLAESR
jgi:hypothetical protein